MTKQQVFELVENAKRQLETNVAVANKCGVSEATISLILNRKWHNVSDKMWQKIAVALDWKPNGWGMAMTMNTRMLFQTYKDAQQAHLWLAVSNPAGSGKTESARHYSELYKKTVFYIQCREWKNRTFIEEIARMVGVAKGSTADNTDKLLSKVINFFKSNSRKNSLLIIDEADKLNPAALRLLIPLYNELEGILGVVIQGTENLKKEIERGVAYERKGMDEIHSRFGRSFLTLPGCTKKDVKEICTANGIGEPRMHTKIWKECSPIHKSYAGQNLEIIRDMRQLKRIIQRELLQRLEKSSKEPEAKPKAA